MTIEERRPNFLLNDLREPRSEERDDDTDAIPITLFNLEEVEPNAEIGAVLAAIVANMTSTVEDEARYYTLMHDLLERVSNTYYNNINNN